MPKYARIVDNDITSLVLEKAYAQMYGGYDVIKGGKAINAMKDLTGSIS